jgi:Tfp pilus assembly protein PilW
MLVKAPLQRARARQQGLSLVELMVGITVGLFIVAAAGLLLSNQLNDNRRLLLEMQLQQDLRATADMVTRDLRRAGHWGVAENGVSNPAIAGSTFAAKNNLLRIVLVGNPSSSIEYRYKRPSNDEGPFKFWLGADGVVRTQLSSSSPEPQALTDLNTLIVTKFEITQNASTPVVLPCPTDCPAGGAADACWPTLTVRDITVMIEGESPNDRAVKRSVTTQLRLRNDVLVFNLLDAAGNPILDPASGSPLACPPPP